MLSLRIAWRFLSNSRVQSIFIVCGIAIGISVQIFLGSLIQSLQASLVEQTIGTGPQITIEAVKNGDPVVYSPRMQNLLASDPRIKPGAVAPVRIVTALWSNGTESAPLNLIGTTVAGANGVYGLKQHLTAGRVALGPNDIVLGKEFADKYGYKVGDPINLSLQGTSATFNVTGIYDLGASAFNERNAFVNAAVPQNLLGWTSDKWSAIYTQVKKPFDAGKIALQWRTQLGNNVDVIDWQTQNANLLTALNSQSVSSYMIQFFVLLAVALGIASTLAISAVQKTRQIGILKAMGLSDGRSGLVFLYQALLLGTLGSLGGVGVAYLLLWAFSFSKASFSITTQPVFVMFSVLVGIFVALVSSIVPIRSTSRLDPIEVIQGG